MWLHICFRFYCPWQWAHSSLQLLIQPWICTPGTHYGWMDRGSVEYEVCQTLLHTASTGNQTPGLLILSPIPYPLGHMLPQWHILHILLHASHGCNDGLLQALWDSMCNVKAIDFTKTQKRHKLSNKTPKSKSTHGSIQCGSKLSKFNDSVASWTLAFLK